MIITDEKTVEVAHEALLSEWGRLKEWIEQDRENLRLSRRLEAECKEWQRNDCSEGLLLTDAWLAAIADWVEKTQPRLSRLEQEFLHNSLEKRDRELQAKVEQERQLRKAAEANARVQKQRTKVAITGVFLAVSLATWALFENHRVFQLEVSAIDDQIKRSDNLLKTNYQLEALTETVKVLDRMNRLRIDEPVFIKRIQNIVYKVHERNRLKAHTDKVTGISFSPDDQTFISSSYDNTIKIWNINRQSPNLTLPNHSSIVWNVKFSPDGKMFASAGLDNTVNLWSVAGKLLFPLKEHKTFVYDVSFSRDSKILASSDAYGNIKLWDTKTGRFLRTLRERNTFGEYRIYSLDFNPAPQSLMIASSGQDDGKVNLWNLKTNDSSETLTPQHQDTVYVVRFSPDGSLLASGSKDNTIMLWNVKSRKLIGTINGHEKPIIDLQFSTNSEFLASGSEDATVKVWRVEDTVKQWTLNKAPLKEPFQTLNGHTDSVNKLAFSSTNSNLLISASDDKTIRFWTIDINSNPYSQFTSSGNVNELLQYSCKFMYEYSENYTNFPQEIREICRN